MSVMALPRFTLRRQRMKQKAETTKTCMHRFKGNKTRHCPIFVRSISLVECASGLMLKLPSSRPRSHLQSKSNLQGLTLISMATPGVEQAAKVCIDIDVRGVRGRQKLPSSHMSKERRLRISDCA